MLWIPILATGLILMGCILMTEKELDKALREKVQKSKLCAQCIYKHENGICFFAYACLHNGEFSNFQSIETGV